MKKFFSVIVLVLVMFTVFAQEEKTAIDLKNQGNEALRAKDYQNALNLFEQALAKWGETPKDTAMTYNMGVCAYQIKNYEKAIGFFDESIKLDYKKQNAFLYKANAFKASKKDDEYKSTLEAALAAYPNDEKVKTALATIYLKEANVFYRNGAQILKDAAADVTANKYKTTDQQYKDADAKAKDEFKKALPIIEKALEFDPSNATAKQLKDACEQNIKS